MGKRVDVGRVLETKEEVLAALDRFEMETPSWGYGSGGTRFHVVRQPGSARTVWERLEDAAAVHRFTGCAPRVAIHLPWDEVDDFPALAQFAEEHGVRVGAVNPNLFQRDEYALGSFTHPNASIRRKALAHVRHCVEAMAATGSNILSLWLPDGTNFPGQDNFLERKCRLEEALRETVEMLPATARLLIEYKFFEPAFYHTDIPDWGFALLLANKLGPQAQVLVDLGHHPQGTNVPYIIATLLSEGKLGGFHLNSRQYADDDLTVGSIDPYELFLIFREIVAFFRTTAGATASAPIAYMIDQTNALKPPFLAMVQAVIRAQELYAKALLVNEEALREAQHAGDLVRAEEIVREAFFTDVRPLLAEWRSRRGVPADPLAAAVAYQEKIAAGRG
ncbi:MAG TPA: L-rhamnose isomerase [Firmicutes bacterium]|nr:L-rhamnose isomerase [Bacillota bacterium]